MKNICFAALLCFLFFVPASCAQSKLDVKNFTITTVSGKSIQVKAELACTSQEREKGFMNRKNIPDGTGMLFVFENDQILRFWMKNTPSALSIAYIDSRGCIRNIFDMQPFSLEGISSTVSVRYALEVPKGWFSRQGIAAGDSIDVSILKK